MKASEVKRSPWSIRPRTLLKLLLFLGLPGGLVLSLLIALAYHPVMVWMHNGDWCVTVDATGKLEAVEYGKACQAVSSSENTNQSQRDLKL